jgi:uncharacterized NAD-dependent epimerase/dehydratase family protein
MKISGKAVVLTNGLFDTKSAKTAHGLIRASKRFSIVAVIDKKFSGKFISLDAHEKIILDENSSGIPIYKDLNSFISSSIEASYCIIGVASAGGLLPDEMKSELLLALNHEMSIINGLHSMLNSDNELSSCAKKNSVIIHDIRKIKSRKKLSFWSGEIASVKCPKVVVMGTDCGLGKRTTAKMVVDALVSKGYSAEMIYTGQTGWMQGWDYGFIFDSTLNDFVSGELEKAIVGCYKEKSPDFILIEGQAALRNPSGPCGGEFLVSCNVDGVILQHSAERKYFDGWEHVGAIIPSIGSEINLINAYGKDVLAIALSSSKMTAEELIAYKNLISKSLDKPVFVPLEEGVDEIADILITLKK